MHIKIPGNYLIQDTFSKTTFLDSNGKQISEPATLKDLEADLMKGLLIVSSPDRNNTVSFNLAKKTASTGNFDQYYDFSKTMLQLMANQQMVNFDTVSSNLHIGNINLRKFFIVSTRTNPIKYSGIYLAFVKGYYLVINADYIDKKFGESTEKVLLAAKFD